MTLTFDLYLTLTLSLTFDLDDLKKYIFFIFFHFLWSHVTQKRDVCTNSGSKLMAHYVIFIEFINVTWRKGVTSYVKTEHLSQKRNFIRNVLQPTRSLCHFRFKSYGPLCDFYKSGDLDLDLYPIFTKIFCQGPWNWVHQLSKFQKYWTSGVACTSCNYGQTDKQTDRQTDKPRWPIYFAKIYDFAK